MKFPTFLGLAVGLLLAAGGIALTLALHREPFVHR